MILTAKFFRELTAGEAYEILKARAEVFVVEQKCVYQDMDDVDYESLHVFCESGGKVISYLRAFPTSDEGVVKVGRVLTLQHGQGDGARLMKFALEEIRDKMQAKKLVIDAQTHALGFYEKFGFKVCSDEFLEVGIPHRKMELFL